MYVGGLCVGPHECLHVHQRLQGHLPALLFSELVHMSEYSCMGVGERISLCVSMCLPQLVQANMKSVEALVGTCAHECDC